MKKTILLLSPAVISLLCFSVPSAFAKLPAEQVKQAEKLAQLAQVRLAADPLKRGRYLETLADWYYTGGDNERGGMMSEKALSAFEEDQRYLYEIPKFLNRWADRVVDHDLDLACQLKQRAVDEIDNRSPSNFQERIAAHTTLVQFYLAHGKLVEAASHQRLIAQIRSNLEDRQTSRWDRCLACGRG